MNINRRFKVIFIGNSNTGKTSIIAKLNDNEITNPSSTIGFEYSDIVSIEKNITLELWDTAGQERYKSMISTFFRQMDACIIVYDITNYKSYEDIQYWLSEINNYNTNDNLLTYLVANKIDLNKEYDFKTDIEFSNKNKMRFVKTSIFNDKSIKNLSNLIFDDLSILKENFIYTNDLKFVEKDSKCTTC